MSYIEFSVTTIDTYPLDKKILINTTFDIDENTVNDKNVILLDKATRNIAEYDLTVSGKTITLELKQWPVPNKEYILSVQNLKTVVGEDLTTGVRRRVYFNSQILSTIKIINPSDGERLKNVKLSWKEEVPDVTTKQKDFIYDKINSYYIEISEDPAFYKIVKTTTVTDKNEIELSKLAKGQYYVRCRAQNEKQYGKWSEVKTFLIDSYDEKPEPIFDNDKDEDVLAPIIEEELEVISFPDDNETPESIIIEFNDEIDLDSIKDLIVMRRSV